MKGPDAADLRPLARTPMATADEQPSTLTIERGRGGVEPLVGGLNRRRGAPRAHGETLTNEPPRPERKTWTKPIIEWEEEYEPVVFTASCASLPFNCGAAARNA